jgi:hypothetical protein
MYECATSALYTVTSNSARVIGFIARYAKDTDGVRNICKIVQTIFDFNAAKGTPIEGYSTLYDTMKSVGDNLGLFKFATNTSEIISGEAIRKNAVNFPNLTRLASRVMMVCGDVLSILKQGEKHALIAAGTAKALVFKTLGVGLEQAEPFIGFTALGLDLVDTTVAAWNRPNFDALFTIGAHVSRLVGIASRGTVIGASFTLAACGIQLSKYVYTNYATL